AEARAAAEADAQAKRRQNLAFEVERLLKLKARGHSQNWQLVLRLQPGFRSAELDAKKRFLLLTLHPDKTGPIAEAAGGEQRCAEAYRIAFAAYKEAKASLQPFLNPPQAPVPPPPNPTYHRARLGVGLGCAHLGCAYRVTKVEFGGFCCKKCHAAFVQGKPSEHGSRCNHNLAYNVRRAQPVPPERPLIGGEAAEEPREASPEAPVATPDSPVQGTDGAGTPEAAEPRLAIQTKEPAQNELPAEPDVPFATFASTGLEANFEAIARLHMAALSANEADVDFPQLRAAVDQLVPGTWMSYRLIGRGVAQGLPSWLLGTAEALATHSEGAAHPASIVCTGTTAVSITKHNRCYSAAAAAIGHEASAEIGQLCVLVTAGTSDYCSCQQFSLFSRLPDRQLILQHLRLLPRWWRSRIYAYLELSWSASH
ncbi:unnamed protein product, partial [Symbiodinium pilosum]